MRKPDESAEPSIEEILASIRSIIADDGKTQNNDADSPNNAAKATLADPYASRFDEYDANEFGSWSDSAAKSGPSNSDVSSEDNVLELTEDFMLAELPAEAEEQKAYEGQLPHDDRGRNQLAPEPVEMPFEASSNLSDLRNEDELDEVLSNLAAEVDRLAAIDDPASAIPDQAPGQDIDTLESSDEKIETADQDLPEQSFPVETSAGEPETPLGKPPSVEMPPVHTAPPQPPVPSSQPKFYSAPQPRTKPVWSARRLEERDGNASQSQTNAARDRWAEGVQMPVPDTGPEMPLPMRSDKNEAAGSSQDDAGKYDPAAAPMNEKSAVGSFLTRVFGHNNSADDETTTSNDEDARDATDGDGIRDTAEKLARTTISDFAEDKLNAPAVGNALKADKAFMDEVASSLENALADAEFSDFDEDDAGPVKVDAGDAVHAKTQTVSPESPSEKTDLAEATAQIVEPETHDQGPETGAVQQPVSEPAETSTPSIAAAPRAHPNEQAQALAESLSEGQPADNVATEPVYDRPIQSAASEDTGNKATAEAQATDDTNTKSQPSTVNEAAPAMPDIGSPIAPLLSPDGLPSSLESSIKEMIKPLIIQWLNDNLPRIVEQAVREELSERMPLQNTASKPVTR